MGLMAVAATISKDRIQPVGRLFIGLISFRSAGGIAGPGSILRPGDRSLGWSCAQLWFAMVATEFAEASQVVKIISGEIEPP